MEPREHQVPLDLSDTLVVGISATALFDLAEADHAFQEMYGEDRDKAIEDYRAYMQERENEALAPGTGFPLAKALLDLNKDKPDGEPSLAEVVVLSRNSPETGVRVLNVIRQNQLNITRSAFTAGESVVDYLEPFDVDLFLTTSVEDAQKVIDSRLCPAAVLRSPPEDMAQLSETQVRIAFDGDAVLFDEASELVYKTEGIEAFHKAEASAEDEPLGEGPYASFLKKLARLQERLPVRVEYSPVRIALVTARNAPADIRAIKTLRSWGVYVDEAFFLAISGSLNEMKWVKVPWFLAWGRG